MKLVAVTSCPTGIAHSQMAAEGLEQAAESLGHDIRVEIQGAMGAEDELTSQEVAEADAVIIAADTSVNRDRFEEKPLVKSAVAKAINEGEELIEEAVEKAEAEGGDTATTADEDTAARSTESAEPTAEPEQTAEPPSSSPQETTGKADSGGGLLGKLKSLFS